MVASGQENLETVLIDFLGALRRADQEAMRAVLDPDVTWQGLREGWVCHGPDEVIDTLQQGLEQRRDVSALEFIRAGDRVVMGVEVRHTRPHRWRASGGADLQRLHPEK